MLIIPSTYDQHSYLIGSKPAKESTAKATPPEPSVQKTLEAKMEDAVRDTKMEYLDKALKEDGKNGTDFNSLYNTLLREYPDHLPLLGKKLRQVNETADMISAADAILDRISEDEVALHFGRKINTDDGDAVKVCRALTIYQHQLTSVICRNAKPWKRKKRCSLRPCSPKR